MPGHDAVLRLAVLDSLFHAIANGLKHIAKLLQVSCGRHLTACGHHAHFTVAPRTQHFDKPFQAAMLLRIELRISVSRKQLAKIQQMSHMEMHQRIGVAVARRLMHNMNCVSIDIERDDLRKCDARTIDSQLDQTLR